MLVTSSGMTLTSLLLVVTLTFRHLGLTLGSDWEELCGGVLTEPRGVIQTPNFPHAFPVPIKCKWVIDTSGLPSNTTVVVYLTQLFVTTGLTFTESVYYDGDNSFGGKVVHTVTEKNIKSSLWLSTNLQYLVVDFELDQLEGNHVRALDGLLDVYGFNITYEARSDVEDAVRTPFCNVVACSYEGHCYGNGNLTEYSCSCFPGFSGSDCGQGPLCQADRNVCLNNATCRHVGANLVYCSCPPGFTGTRCDVIIPSESSEDECLESDGKSCVYQCPYHEEQTPCACTDGMTRAPTEKSRYQITIQLATQPGFETVEKFINSFEAQTLQYQLENQILEYLSRRISKIDELRIMSISTEGEVMLHFFGGKNDGRKVRVAVNELVEKRHLGNITFVSTKMAFKQEPTLLLKTVEVNTKSPVVRYGDEFILSCIAQGSSYMTFRWLKDGIAINEDKSVRNIWTKLLQKDSQDQYTALLSIKQADELDRGRYTCHVTDWGQQQCHHIDLEVIPPPLVRVQPITITAQKGQDLKIVCMWPIERADLEQVYGYSWLKETRDSKEAHLFKMRHNYEVWEDLHPAGSILRVYNIQKSTRYTCQVQSNVSPVNASVDVEILNKAAVPWCRSEKHFYQDGLPAANYLQVLPGANYQDVMKGSGSVIKWEEVGAWGVARAECPPRYQGVSTRMCALGAKPGSAHWLEPDFSRCVSERFGFKALTLGYQNTTGTETISGILGLLRDKERLYRGEAEPALSLLHNISWFLNFTAAWNDLIRATPFFFSTINTVLQRREAIINANRIVDLQKLVADWTLAWAKHSHPIGSDPTMTLDSLVVDVFSYEHSAQQPLVVFNLPRSTHRSPTCADVAINNLSFSWCCSDGAGSELEYEVASNVVQLVASTSQHVASPVQHVDLRLETRMRHGWSVACGMLQPGATEWLLDDACKLVQHVAGGNVTRCQCRQTGTFAAVITKSAAQADKRPYPQTHGVVLLGCVCCTVQALFTVSLLLIRFYHSPSCLMFLKIQCCSAVTAAMAVFFSANSFQKSSYLYIVTCLEGFLLFGMSSHLSKLLLVYTEIVSLPKIPNIKLTVICIINGFTIIVVLCTYLVHNSLERSVTSWWLVKDSLVYQLCSVGGLLLAALFILLYLVVMRRLAQLINCKKVSQESVKAIRRRVGLLKRAAIIFMTIFLMTVASIFYVNYPGLLPQYAFSLSCALLGFVLLICYVLHSESSLHFHLLHKLGADVAYSSASDSNILSFFTKQDGETESEAAPPIQDGGCSGRGVGDVESAQLLEALPFPPSSNTSSQTDGSTNGRTPKMVKFQSDYVPVGEPGTGDPITDHHSSQKPPAQSQPVTSPACDDQSQPREQWQFVRTSYSQTPGSDYIQTIPGQQEVVTTRVCVELGVITNGDKCDNSVDVPSIVVCSVDVEPCPGKVVELSEVTVKTMGELNGGSLPMEPTVEYVNSNNITRMVTSADQGSSPSRSTKCNNVTKTGDNIEMSRLGNMKQAGDPEFSRLGNMKTAGDHEMSRLGNMKTAGDHEMSRLGNMKTASDPEFSRLGNTKKAGDLEMSRLGNTKTAGDIEMSRLGNMKTSGDLEMSRLGNMKTAGDPEFSRLGNTTAAGDLEMSRLGNMKTAGDLEISRLGNTKTAGDLNKETIVTADSEMTRLGATTEPPDNSDMFDRITHDLDYLLNRTTQHDTNGNESSTVITPIQRLPPLLKIIEEDELGNNTVGQTGVIAKTSL
ncbi:uncharacterized protein LOC111062656 [Nilaparvata lugens]|uniref:uncharacterized protein LOC111062656 n=1 Tax=Nilaparvata lugens TaxID=108931 RepID=UPI00193EA716|nr:uncharacterized protein LOC111062656 [Nilaparvata lugens]